MTIKRMGPMTIKGMLGTAELWLEGYKTDLDIDRKLIADYPGRPFIHITRDYGTHMTVLMNYEDYPKGGETVPYLFGTAGRYQLLDGVRDFYEAVLHTWRKPDIKKICYYDGKEVKKIDEDTGRAIIETYIANMKIKFLKGGRDEHNFRSAV